MLDTIFSGVVDLVNQLIANPEGMSAAIGIITCFVIRKLRGLRKFPKFARYLKGARIYVAAFVVSLVATLLYGALPSVEFMWDSAAQWGMVFNSLAVSVLTNNAWKQVMEKGKNTKTN